MPKINKTFVDSIAAGDKPVFHWDETLKGFGVKVSPTGRKTFVFQYRLGGGRSGSTKRMHIGTYGTITPEQARSVARDLAGRVASGENPAGSRDEFRDAPKMVKLFECYLEDHAKVHKKPRSIVIDEGLIRNRLEPEFGRKKVVELDRSAVIAFHRKLSDVPYIANRSLALLSKMMNLAEVWGMRPDGTNPCRHVKKYKEVKRERFLSEAEFIRLGSALDSAERHQLENEKGERVWVNPAAVLAIRLLIFTGARQSEILGLKWDQLDFEQGRAYLPDTKTGGRFLYFPAPALQLLASLDRHENAAYVVPGGAFHEADGSRPLVNLKDAWARICKAAELKDVRLHDLRHSFASVAVSSGMGLPLVGALLGHRETATTARYAHLADDPLRSAANSIAGRLNDALSRKKRSQNTVVNM
jgi:integrase